MSSPHKPCDDGHRCEDCGLPSDKRFCPSCLDEAAHESAGLREEAGSCTEE